MVFRRRPFRLAAALLLAAAAPLASAAPLAPAASALAQRGGLRGLLTDPDGQPVPGVRVSIVLADGGGRPVTVETNEDGRFTRAGLQVGMYRVTMERDGWEPLQAIVNISTGSQSFIEETIFPLPEGVLSPQEAQEAEAHLQAAQQAFESGDLEAAAEGFRAFTELAPNSAGAFFNLGATYERLQDYPEAIEAYEQAFTLDPSLNEGLLAVADLHGRLQQWSEAVAAFDRVMDLVEASAVNLYNYATYANNAQRLDLALEFYEKAAVADPQLANAPYQIGMITYGEKDFQVAVEAFARVVEIDSTSALAASALDMLEIIESQSPEAMLPFLEQRLETAPNDTALLYKVGTVRQNAGDAAGAGEAFLLYLELAPDGQESSAVLERIERDLPAAAVIYYERQSTTMPDDPDTWSKIGTLKYGIGDFSGAVTALERYLELAPDSENAEAVRQLLTDAKSRS